MSQAPIQVTPVTINPLARVVAEKKALFKKLLRFALVMALVCLVLFFWCTARYTSSAHTNRFAKLTAIDGASAYYDWNRNRNHRNGFQSLKTVAWNKPCFEKTDAGKPHAVPNSPARQDLARG
jgi:hypothetical protein